MEVVGLRWFSVMNPDMDCVVFVADEQETDASNAITIAIDRYWDGECEECYGDAIENELRDRGIPYFIVYEEQITEWQLPGFLRKHTPAQVPATRDLDLAWEKWLDSLPYPIRLVRY